MTRAVLLLLLGALAPGMAPTPTNDLFVVNSNNGNIVRVLPSGEVTPFSHLDEIMGLGAVGFAVNARGYLYLAAPVRTSGLGGYAIYQVDNTGKTSVFASGFPQLGMLAFAADGTLFAGASGTLYKISPAGTVTSLPTGVSGPTGMAFDAHGTLYVSNVSNGSIVKVNPDTGAVTPFARDIQWCDWQPILR